MELKKLIKNTSFLAGTSVFQFVAGIVRSKINAVILGPVGIGIINQLSFMSQKMSQFTMLTMSDAVVKQIAENKDKKEMRQLVSASLKSYIILSCTFMIFSIVVFLIFSRELTTYVLGDNKYLNYFFIGLFSFPILILNSIPYAIMKGFKDVRSISLATIGIVVINLIVFLPLILLFKLQGAVVFIPVSYIVTLLINYMITRKKYLIRLNLGLGTILRAEINKRFVKELLLFSGYGLIVGSYMIVSEFICRSVVVKNLGVDAIGLYRPIISWSQLFITFLFASFSTYLYPRFAETKSNKEATGVLNDTFRLSTFLLIPFVFLGIPYRNILIKLLYSSEFVEAGLYLPYHFIGMVFYIWWYTFTQSMAPTGRIKIHGAFMVLFLTLDIIVTSTTVPAWGLYGWMLKHIVSPVVFFLVYFIYLKKNMLFKFDTRNILVMIYLITGSFILLIGVVWVKYTVYMYFIGPILVAASWYLLEESERKIITDKLYKITVKLFKS